MKWILCFSFATVLCATCFAANPLTADQIALIVNRNEPKGEELARFYSQARGIPDGRIIALDMPVADDMSFEQYERNVVPIVRQFLRSNGLQQKVRSLVTFYGVPLRVGDRVNSQADNRELVRIRDLARRLQVRLSRYTRELETRLTEVDSAFKPYSNEQSLQSLEQIGLHLTHAARGLETALERTREPAAKKKLEDFATEFNARMTGPVDIEETGRPIVPTTGATDPVDDSAARAAVRENARRTAGIFNYAAIVQSQVDYFTTEATAAAFDSELAFLWVQGYARTKWQPNPLYIRNHNPRQPPVIMVTRLDAGTSQTVRDLIANTIAAEREGLHGKLVVDAQGKSPVNAGKPDGMGIFDQQLRELAEMGRKASLSVYLDDKPEVIPANSVTDVALYCGWYRLRDYLPGMKFNRGAVGYHVASFELASLHQHGETGWVHGLIRDGVVASVGPVAEPYLHSFPPPREFFGLLLTGKMTLAEVYWTSTPMASWMQVCIGDPLYNPYAKTPVLKAQDLPDVYRSLLE